MKRFVSCLSGQSWVRDLWLMTSFFKFHKYNLLKGKLTSHATEELFYCLIDVHNLCNISIDISQSTKNILSTLINLYKPELCWLFGSDLLQHCTSKDVTNLVFKNDDSNISCRVWNHLNWRWRKVRFLIDLWWLKIKHNLT